MILMNEFRRRARNIGYFLLVTAGIVASKTAYDYARDIDLGSFLGSDKAFISVAHKNDLVPYLDKGDSLYVLGSEKIVTNDLSDIVYLIIAADKDGIRDVSLTFDGWEFIKAHSENPKDKGLKTFGFLDPSFSEGPGEYTLRIRVTDQKGNTMTESAIVELRRNEKYI